MSAPSVDDLKNILATVGAELIDDDIELLLSEIKDKDITELIATGREKMAPVPCGGNGAAVAVATTGGASSGAGARPAAAETKKDENVEEKRRIG